ncbi:MAG: MFS transporter [Deltaproteobacteria bacterium]|nr:MFS transporter [Deltaproteobacteria bacterium]
MKNTIIGHDKTTGNKIFYGWRIVAACFILLFCFGGAGFYSFSIFIKPFEEYFGWTRSQVALAMSIFFLVNGGAQPLLGRFCRTIGPKKVIIIGCLTSGVSFILVSLTKSLWYYYFIYAVLSLTLSAITFVPVSTLLSVWFERRRGTAIGLAYIGISAGGLILSPAIGAIITGVGLQQTFIILGLLMWALALPVSVFVIKDNPSVMGLLPDGDAPMPLLKDEPLKTDKLHASILDEGWPLAHAIKSGQFWWIIITFFLSSLAMMGVLQHQVPLISEKGIPYTSATVALGMTSAIGGIGKFGLGRLTESFTFKWVVLICLGMQLIGLLILLNLHTMTMVWLYAMIFGFGMGGVIVLQPLAISRYFGLASFGVLLGICQLSHSIGSSLGSFTSGVLYDRFGDYQHALMVYIAVYITGIAAMFLAGKPKRYGR